MIIVLNIKELKLDCNDNPYDDGYRIVYFYEDGSYNIGEYCKTIEGFMIGLAECDPIIDEDDIPKYVSNEDLLRRSLSFDNKAISAAIYKTDGTLVDKFNRELNEKYR